MASADALRRRLESLRFRGKWADVKGVAEDNDAIMAGGGFDLASDGDKQVRRGSACLHCLLPKAFNYHQI